MRERFITVVVPAKVKDEQEVHEPTLRESLGERKFPLRQRQAIAVLDEMDISLMNKRNFFFYFLWQETGSFGSIKEYGDIREDPRIDSILDSVMDDDKLTAQYEVFYQNYKNKTSGKTQGDLLSQRHQAGTAVSELDLDMQVLSLKNQKLSHIEIASKLGISKKQVDIISKDLIAMGRLEPSLRGRAQAIKFSEFTDEIEKIDDPKVSDKEIASKLNTSLSRVERARKRLRMQGRIPERSPKDVAQSQKRSRLLLPLRERTRFLISKGLTTSKIAEITGATSQQVKHQRVILKRASRQQ